MPWKAVGNNIVRADTGKVVGHSTSHAKAMASVRARYANAGAEAGKDSFAHMGVRASKTKTKSSARKRA